MKKVKSFKTFESKYQISTEFPDFEVVKGCFYEFTDEIGTSIQDYDLGYIFFPSPANHRIFSNLNIDILNTDLSNGQLDYRSEQIQFNHAGRKTHQNRLKLIESGEEPGYPFYYIQLENHLFEKNKLPILIDCLKTMYLQTGFRLIKSLWTEDYVDDVSGEVVQFYGFEGTFVKVSDPEYKKLCQIFQQGGSSPLLTKLF
jgi:hypothetical protein